MKVDLAVVRWSGGGAFGVEFLRMGDKAWERIHHFVATVAYTSAWEKGRATFIMRASPNLSPFT